MNRAFLVWAERYLQEHPSLSLDAALALWTAHYVCSCESCEQRTRLGLLPLPVAPGCRAPSSAPDRLLVAV